MSAPVEEPAGWLRTLVSSLLRAVFVLVGWQSARAKETPPPPPPAVGVDTDVPTPLGPPAAQELHLPEVVESLASDDADEAYQACPALGVPFEPSGAEANELIPAGSEAVHPDAALAVPTDAKPTPASQVPELRVEMEPDDGSALPEQHEQTDHSHIEAIEPIEPFLLEPADASPVELELVAVEPAAPQPAAQLWTVEGTSEPDEFGPMEPVTAEPEPEQKPELNRVEADQPEPIEVQGRAEQAEAEPGDADLETLENDEPEPKPGSADPDEPDASLDRAEAAEEEFDRPEVAQNVPQSGRPLPVVEHPDLGSTRPTTVYRPRLRERSGRETPRSVPSPGTGQASLEADLLLAFRPGEWGVSVSVLLRRPEGMPENVQVNVAGERCDLSIIDDALYEPVPIDQIGQALELGIAIESVGTLQRRWVRTGRQLHVFSEKAGVLGFSSVPRCFIGQENVVLCRTELADRVTELCLSTGSDAPREIGGPGIPGGWRCFRGFRPLRPGVWEDEEFYLALSPFPDAAIELTGGVSISRNRWLSGRPPAVRILGTAPAAGEVTIDGQVAAAATDGTWIADDWDAPGSHVVRYGGLSRRYEIATADEGWTGWPAHVGSELAVVGALGLSGATQAPLVLRESNCWLLGRKPGEIVKTSLLPGIGSYASPPFEPVWVVSAKPGRRRTSPRLVSKIVEPLPLDRLGDRLAIRTWSAVVRKAARLPPDEGGQAASDLWLRYLTSARSLRKWAR